MNCIESVGGAFDNEGTWFRFYEWIDKQKIERKWRMLGECQGSGNCSLISKDGIASATLHKLPSQAAPAIRTIEAVRLFPFGEVVTVRENGERVAPQSLERGNATNDSCRNPLPLLVIMH